MGNAFVMQTSSSKILYSWRNNKYYEYVLTMRDINNPNIAQTRVDGSYDLEYIDYDINDDYNLWNEYDEYTKKFEIAVFDDDSSI